MLSDYGGMILLGFFSLMLLTLFVIYFDKYQCCQLDRQAELTGLETEDELSPTTT